MKINNRNYISAAVVKAANAIEINNILDFCQYVDNHAIKDIFLISDLSKFAVLAQNSLLQVPTFGYQNLDDAKKATQNFFPSSEQFYLALEAGIENFEDYDMIKKWGITDKSEFDQIQNAGFIDGYKKYRLYLEQNESINVDIPVFSSAFDLYTYSKSKHFTNFDDCFSAIEAGFSNYGDYAVALEKGFQYAKDYKYAIDNGFPDYETYKAAIDLHIKTYLELIQKSNLELSYPELPHDQSVFLFLLSKLEQGKKVSVNKLATLLESAIEEYQDVETKELSPWFTKTIETPSNVAAFLQSNSDVKKFGSYDSDGEFFEINSIKDRSVVIDGSNVAYNSIHDKSQKPSLGNLIILVKYLKEKGFNDIIIIADASLKHRVSDLDRMDELTNLATYKMSPAETAADIFIISYVKSKHCLFISNDTYREYKIADPWTAMNIDYFRLNFMITDEGEVHMPDLK